MSTLKVNAINSTAASSGGLAIDTAGNVTGLGMDLITPSSIAYSGGSASATGGAVSFSGVSSISLNGVFSSTYDHYRIMLNNSASATSTFMRLRSSGTDNTTSDYSYADYQYTSANVAQANAYVSAGTSWLVQTLATEGVASVDLFNPFAARHTAFTGTHASSSSTTAYLSAQFYGGGFKATTSFDGFTIYPSSGTITGTVRVYGYKN